jgi:hypothetical protein
MTSLSSIVLAMKSITASHLSDAALIEEIKRLSQSGREVTVALIVHLAELEARRLHLAGGFSSLFLYCTEVLRLSEAEAYNRIQAARVARRFPRVLDMLLDCSLNLTTVKLLAPELTDENHVELLNEAAHKSKWEVQKLLARHAPRPDTPGSIRKLPVPNAMARMPAPDPDVEAPAVPSPRAASFAASPRPPRPVLTPLAADRYQVTFTASGSTCEKLRLAKDLLRHAVPSGDTAEIVDRALSALLEDLASKKYGGTKRRPANHIAEGTGHKPEAEPFDGGVVSESRAVYKSVARWATRSRTSCPPSAVPVEHPVHIPARHQAHAPFRGLRSPEHDQGGQALDGVALGGARVLVHVDEAEARAAPTLGGQGFQRLRGRAGGHAPFRPEHHRHRFGRGQDGGVPAAILEAFHRQPRCGSSSFTRFSFDTSPTRCSATTPALKTIRVGRVVMW